MPSLPSPLSTFSAADDPWIEVRTGHRYDTTGLRGLFLTAHTIDDLAVPYPPAASALLRIAVAITARITGLDDPDLTAAQWTRLRREAFRQGAFDPQAVHAYFDRHHFGVFHPTRPWLQDPSLPDHCTRTEGINRFTPGRPGGNNLAWFSAHHHELATPVPTGQALQYLLIHHFYGPSGAGTPRTIGKTTSKTLYSGPLRATVSFHPLGRTLHETLLAGLPKFLGDEQTLTDTCPWEEGHAPDDPAAAPHPATWPGRLLAGRSRHAVLLIPGDDQQTVTDAYVTWSTQKPKLEATDPYLAYRIDPSKPADERRTLRRADADRAWWRELDSLVLAPDEYRAQRRPEVFDTLNDLPPDVRSTLRVRVHGFDQDGKAVNRQWYTALTPPLWAWTQEHDPDRAQRIAEGCQAAEDFAVRLTQAADTAWADTTTPRNDSDRPKPGKPKPSLWAAQAAALYWPLAETAFWEVLDDDTPADRVFARQAVTALRQATRTARARNQQAARAVATAVRTLRSKDLPPKKSSHQ